jgi:cytochrome c peroxidase
VALGKQLFFDPRLSGNNKTSCGSCHLPTRAFTDRRPMALGQQGRSLSRNTPTVVNSGFLKHLLWDGRATSLEQQALLPIASPTEMNQDLGDLESELNAIPGYVTQFQRVFESGVTRTGIARALATFQRTLVSGPSPLDRFLAGDKSALSEEARSGLELFRGGAGCIRCHNGPLLSDGKFYRLGVSLKDKGRQSVTGKPTDAFRFRTPSLRNISRTAPYMHNGSQKTLEDVVTFYYRGVPTTSPDNLPLDVEPLLGNSFSEISDIVAFLKSLTGEPLNITPPKLP